MSGRGHRDWTDDRQSCYLQKPKEEDIPVPPTVFDWGDLRFIVLPFYCKHVSQASRSRDHSCKCLWSELRNRGKSGNSHTVSTMPTRPLSQGFRVNIYFTVTRRLVSFHTVWKTRCPLNQAGCWHEKELWKITFNWHLSLFWRYRRELKFDTKNGIKFYSFKYESRYLSSSEWRVQAPSY